ncbi:MAG: S1C family serine protease [Oscillospiraceae bacterium]|nr:S1C family serine protease [Oscillospiraceae bacterium]
MNHNQEFELGGGLQPESHRPTRGGFVPYDAQKTPADHKSSEPTAAEPAQIVVPPKPGTAIEQGGTWYGSSYASGNGLRTPTGMMRHRPPARRPAPPVPAPAPVIEVEVPEDTKTPPPQQKRRSRRKLSSFQVICLLLVCAIIGGGTGAFVARTAINDWEAEIESVLAAQSVLPTPELELPIATPTPPPAEPIRTGNRLSAEEVFALGREQVVGITTEVTSTNVFGQSSTGRVSGSGFIVSSDGYILTNYHVIEGATRILVMLADGTIYEASLVGGENITSDMAVLKIEAEGLPAATIGNSDDLRVGAGIFAIGNPLGELTHTITSGIVSALDREVAIDQGQTLNMFQIDAAVNTGNSGGPVYNEFGEVVGIVTAKSGLQGVEGIGFAIPIDDAMGYANQLIERGYIPRPHLGIFPVTVTEDYAYFFNTVVGVFVNTVYPDTAAQRGGILEGDVIVALGGREVTTVEALRLALGGFAPGDAVTVTVFRNGSFLDLDLILGDRPAEDSGNGSVAED